MAKHVEFFPPKRNDGRLTRQKDVSKSGNGKGPIVVEGITSRTAEEGEVKCGSLMGSWGSFFARSKARCGMENRVVSFCGPTGGKSN